jgi:hypothetical protein
VAERSSQWRGVFCPTTRRLFADLSAKTAKVITTPTFFITFTLVIALAAWAVMKDIKSKRGNKKNSPEEISKRIGVPLELYLEHERDSSIAIDGLIGFLSIKNKNPQKIEYLKLLKEEKIIQEEESKKIADKIAALRESEGVASPEEIEAYERYQQKVSAVFGLVKGFIICYAIKTNNQLNCSIGNTSVQA